MAWHSRARRGMKLCDMVCVCVSNLAPGDHRLEGDLGRLVPVCHCGTGKPAAEVT